MDITGHNHLIREPPTASKTRGISRGGCMSNQEKKGIGLGEAVAIGIGGMVGGGIFAVLGLAVQLSGGGTTSRSQSPASSRL
jgi:hypothetical protein